MKIASAPYWSCTRSHRLSTWPSTECQKKRRTAHWQGGGQMAISRSLVWSYPFNKSLFLSNNCLSSDIGNSRYCRYMPPKPIAACHTYHRYPYSKYHRYLHLQITSLPIPPNIIVTHTPKYYRLRIPPKTIFTHVPNTVIIHVPGHHRYPWPLSNQEIAGSDPIVPSNMR